MITPGGSIRITPSVDECLAALQRSSYTNKTNIIVMDYDNRLEIGGPILGGTILTPTAEIMNYYIDGNFELFNQAYADYLNMNPHVASFMDTMAAAVYQGKELIIYVEADGYVDLPYMDFVCTVFFTRYNIVIGFPGRAEFSISDPNPLTEAAYNVGVINGYEFLGEHPVGYAMRYDTLNKLMNEFQPYIYGEITPQVEFDYFNNFKIDLRSSGGVELEEVVTMKKW